MAYDRYDGRDQNRGYRDDQQRGRGGERDDRGFFERARDEVSSWFGDEQSGGRREQDDRMSHPGSSRGYESHGDNQRRGYGSDFSGSNRGFEPRAYDQDEGRQRRGREDDRFGHSDRSAFFGGGQSTSLGRGRDEGDYRNQYGRGGGESGGFGRGEYGHQGERFYGRQGQDHGNLDQGRSYPSGYGQTGGGSYRETQHQSYGFDRQQDDDRQNRGFQSQGSDRYRPMTGDYGRGSSQGQQHGSGFGSQEFGREQYGRQDFSQDQDRDRSYNYGGWGDRDSQRQSQSQGFGGQSQAFSHDQQQGRSGFMGGSSSFGRGAHDDHYSSWRQRQIEDLDRDYDEYRREHQSRFENEFSSFRTQRQTKRQMLQSIREHFEVVDESGQHIGTVDKVRGDKVILTKNDPEAGGVHRSFTCSLLERVEDNKVYLSGSKDSIRSRLTEEHDDRQDRGSSGGGILGSLFGSSDDSRSDDQRSATAATAATTTSSTMGTPTEGPHMLDQSFSGTYDDDSSKSSSTKR